MEDLIHGSAAGAFTNHILPTTRTAACNTHTHTNTLFKKTVRHYIKVHKFKNTEVQNMHQNIFFSLSAQNSSTD